MPSVRWRVLAAIGVLLTLSACAQHPGQVAVGIGTRYYEFQPAKPYAALYLPYARMSAVAYTDEQFLTSIGPQGRLGQLCPLVERLNDPALADALHPGDTNLQLAAWLSALQHEGWECIYGRVGIRNCPPGERCVDGLQYQVWRRKDCSEAVIAFRGSDRGDIGDWLTNLRWFRAQDVFDQYDQVQQEVVKVVARLRAPKCRPKTIIATGHSLGGGLAQHASYTGGIDYVYAFDPSPVTALFGVSFLTRQQSVEKLGVDRIYEAGEILSVPRYITSGFYPTSRCQPRVRIVRFDVVDASSLIGRHNITELAKGIERTAAGPKPVSLPSGIKDAATCDLAGGP